MPGPNPRGQAFGALLKERRRRARLTQDQVVELSGVSRSTYLRWEGGEADRPEPDQVRAVCRVLNIGLTEAMVALGYLELQDLEPPDGEALPPEVAEVVESLRNPLVPDADKRSWVRYLKYLQYQHTSPPTENGRRVG